MSDHGFAAFDRAVHLNTWLLREGFLAATPGPEEMFARVDWSRTQAYALGLNAVYLNLRGRERNGIVAPGLQAQIALRVLSRRLRDFRDPETGAPVVSGVYSPGGASAVAPDLIVGYNPPYRSSWQSAMGAVAGQIIEYNRDAWIGDHCVAAPHVPGVLLVNRPVRVADPQLADLPVTILNEFGLPRPSDIHGRVVF
jgi:predicted AlkP superfamily phosphohydrolase/phosphomutase